MPNVYGGDMLAAFPELLDDYEIFKMEPRIGGGYGERHSKRTVTGYWSWRKHAGMAIEGDLSVINDRATFWVQDDFLTGECLIEQGDFCEVKGKVFKVIDEDNFSREGGFARCLMQRVASLDGRQVSNTAVDENVRSDY